MAAICVIGLGYIGLPTALVLALSGHAVTGVDTNRQLLQELSHGKTHLKEPSLGQTIKLAIAGGNLSFAEAPVPADVFVIAVPTPYKEDRSCDLSFVMQAINTTLTVLGSGNLIVVESTIPPMTCEETIRSLIEKEGFVVGKDIFLSHCPERIMPGKIMREISENDRVIGGYTEDCARRAADVYSTFVTGQIMLTDLRSAEMTKLMENTFRDVNIALANEMAKICDRLGIDVLKAIEMANKHPRVNFLRPGPGVGGHCLAVDPYFIIEKTPDLATLIAEARKINSEMPGYIVNKTRSLLAGIDLPKICIFGVSYKGDVEDTRESPALEVLRSLGSEGFQLSVYDPYALYDGQEKNPEEAVRGMDMILILTDHSEFKTIDYTGLSREMRHKIIFDTRGILKEDNLNSDISLYNLGTVFHL